MTACDLLRPATPDDLEPHSHPSPTPSSNLDIDLDSDSEPEEPALTLTIHLHNKPIDLPFYHPDATIQDLSDTVAETLHIPPANQKFLITPKTGLLKPPFKDPSLPLQTLLDKKIVLMGATTTEVSELLDDIALRQTRMLKRREALRAGRKVQASKTRDWKKVQDESRYTFHTLRPLPYLPNPAKSLRYLERLRDDAGIKAAMRSHGFSVGLLTEMNPAEHTTHESKTLGLNRNRGEVIELRLRTDSYDGYRDYKVIRKTLCHELAHNVFGEHDRKFWDLMQEIEREVERNDWRAGGHSVGGEEFFNPRDEGVDNDDVDGGEADEGGWTGGEYVLGVGVGVGGASSMTESRSEEGPLSRREILARAAEERMRRQEEVKKAKARDTEAK
ncbi:hypothetical protein BAUCODRAFT_470002 [Baudoinia panamericana UAMH 10762]|uniref:WLM domain-containing protein n=1 Tax=Baudoinia panamericana (strain UAMH 10762) TaxID=717646 RepID=M2NAX4_BAUPA|nr:uncharacterized protein BAUCODRAFT_470002 [Baudoinia panamericana UAMH 10762]EMC96299.1 hypothetical protein BAUCODRAFT_470002 [Baudoinia panamericana UAMH 10762]